MWYLKSSEAKYVTRIVSALFSLIREKKNVKRYLKYAITDSNYKSASGELMLLHAYDIGIDVYRGVLWAYLHYI